MRRSLAFALPLALYVASAYRDVMYWDIGEMDTVPYILGIAHPPGMPLYTLLGWAFTHAVPIGSVAFRMSLLSALAMAATAWFVAAIVADETGDELAALAAALLFAVGEDAWSHGTRAEAHALAVLAFAAIARFTLRWLRSGRARDFYLAAVAFGAGVAVHPVVAFAGIGILAAAIVRLASDLDARVLARGCAAALGIVAACYAYLPLRSAWIDAHHLDPLARYGIAGSAFWNYADPATTDGFVTLVTGRDVDVGSQHFGATNAAFTSGVVAFAADTVLEFTVAGALLGIAGLVVLYRRSAARATVALLVLVPSALFGCAFGAESDVQRYFLPAFVLLAAGSGIACAALVRLRLAALAAVLACCAFLIFSQREFFHQPRDDRAALEAGAVLAATPPGAVVIATWILAPPLAYDAYVEKRAGARLIVPAWYGEVEDELPGWTARRPVFVAGTPQGSVPGYHLERIASSTELYRVVRDTP